MRAFSAMFRVFLSRLLEEELRDWPTPRVREVLGDLDAEQEALLRQQLVELVEVLK